jgi:hypothetical protein
MERSALRSMIGFRYTPVSKVGLNHWLSYAAEAAADRTTRLSGDAVADLDLSGMEPVPETRGNADTWWQGTNSLVAIHTGEAQLFGRPDYRIAHLYSGNFGRKWL